MDKPFEPHKSGQNKIESHEERNVKEEKYQHESRMLLRRGLTLFEFNRDTGILKKAEFETNTVKLKTDKRISGNEPGKDSFAIRKIIYQENCAYFQKLNFKNAVKMLMRAGIKDIKIQK